MKTEDLGLLTDGLRADRASRRRTRSRRPCTRPSLEGDATVGPAVDRSRSPDRRRRSGSPAASATPLPRSRPTDGSSPSSEPARRLPRSCYVVDGAGGEPVQVTDRKLGVSEFAWAPDGASLAFVSRVPEQGRYGTVGGDRSERRAAAAHPHAEVPGERPGLHQRPPGARLLGGGARCAGASRPSRPCPTADGERPVPRGSSRGGSADLRRLGRPHDRLLAGRPLARVRLRPPPGTRRRPPVERLRARGRAVRRAEGRHARVTATTRSSRWPTG